MRTYSKLLVTSFCLLVTSTAGFFLHGVIGRASGQIVPAVQAQEDRGPRRCSARTLKGGYGIKFEGQKINVGPYASVSRITFDGEGHFTTSEIGRFNGNPVDRTFLGPYTVNEDCTGFLDFSSNLTNPPHIAHGDFVIVDEGKQFFVVDNEEGWAASRVGRKL